MSGPLRTFSHGGGVQSTAALVLSADGRIDFPVHLFANVGDDSEAPETLAYVRQVSMPYAAKHGIELIELRKPGDTLLERLSRADSRSVEIPVRMSNGAPGNRRCTKDYKLAVVARWHRDHGATKNTPAVVGIGFSADPKEIARMGRTRRPLYERAEYPLIELGLRRSDCLKVIADAGLPQPPKSACWFCPMHPLPVWREMARDKPERFAAAADLERSLSTRRGHLGKDAVFLTRTGLPLEEAVSAAQDPLFTEDGWGETCDEGVCFI